MSSNHSCLKSPAFHLSNKYLTRSLYLLKSYSTLVAFYYIFVVNPRVLPLRNTFTRLLQRGRLLWGKSPLVMRRGRCWTWKYDAFSNSHEAQDEHVRSKVLTPVVMNSFIFWDIAQCGPLKVSKGFGGTYRMYLQVRRVSQARKTHEARNKQRVDCFVLVSSFAYFLSWRWRQYIPLKHLLSLNGLHDVIPQKMKLCRVKSFAKFAVYHITRISSM
jgi:hypothetical protein